MADEARPCATFCGRETCHESGCLHDGPGFTPTVEALWRIRSFTARRRNKREWHVYNIADAALAVRPVPDVAEPPEAPAQNAGAGGERLASSRLPCWLRGHRWGPWANGHTNIFGLTHHVRWCRQCGERNTRSAT